MLMPSVFGESLFDDFFDFPEFEKMEKQLQKNLYGHHAAAVMKSDVKEHDDHYEMIIDLPGFTKDEVSAEVENGYLTISAAKGVDKDEGDGKNEKYIRRERYAGCCRRSFFIGQGVRKEDIGAKFEHGILTLTIPKAPKLLEENSRRIEIT